MIFSPIFFLDIFYNIFYVFLIKVHKKGCYVKIESSVDFLPD